MEIKIIEINDPALGIGLAPLAEPRDIKPLSMKLKNEKFALIESKEIVIHNHQDALDLLATISYNYGVYKIIIYKENITENFFDLKTGLAGEILQKFTNYGVSIAIIGDFSVYKSKSLKDFIFECNKGNKILFKDSIEEAINLL